MNHKKSSLSSLMFLKSALETEGKFYSVPQTIEWLKTQNDKVKVNLEKVKFSELKTWRFDENTGALRHLTGKFFSIVGIDVKTNWGEVYNWQQPIINQPEIGYLGFLTKEFDGILYFLLQAKIEPGNVNYVQLSPTLQATRSNYTQVHKGKKPLYLDYFIKANNSQILLDQLQSEQGARFLRKRNRNIIIKIDEEVPVYDNFIWLTLGQIKKLLVLDNIVNMDTRTVLSGIPFGSFQIEIIDLFNYLRIKSNESTIKEDFLLSALNNQNETNSVEDIITFLTKLKSAYDLDIEKTPISKLKNWSLGESEISHEEHKYFKVIAVNVEIGNREVISWDQPMVMPVQEGLCAFVCKKINGILHFAVQAKLECGNHDIIEFAPTVQCLTGNYRQTKEGALPFLDYVLNSPRDRVIFDTIQSEEGGRFFREQNRNMIIMAGDEISIELPENYIWMTLNQLYTFLRFNNYLNIQARSLISAISFV